VTNRSYRPAEESDGPVISAVVNRALPAETLPGWTPEAISSLLAKASPEAMRKHIGEAAFAHVALDHESIVGFILCKHSRFLNLLVVEPTLQRQGIGSHLIRRMLQQLANAAPELSVVEVNATEYSLPFYRRLGFYPLSEFIEFDGCRFARLGHWRKNPLRAKSEC
jgi:ribosomal protein S18 acetylase RimI-like enzyme